MILDISQFERALDRLAKGLTRYESDITDSQIRDGLIQRFEFSYDLAHKMLRRYLATAAAASSDYDTMAFPDLIRAGNRQGLLLGEWSVWRQYREMRNITSHTYDEAKASTVAAAIPAFMGEARYLRERLRERLA